MKVRDVMRKRPRSCRVAQDLAAAARTMAEVDCGVLPVVAEDGKVAGVITDRDVCLALARGDRRPSEVGVGEVMTRRVHTCQADDDVRAALGAMRRGRVRRLPVVDDAGGLVGLLSLDDVVLEARALETGDFKGPFYVDVAETLKAINRHLLPAPPARSTAATRGAGQTGRRGRAGAPA